MFKAALGSLTLVACLLAAYLLAACTPQQTAGGERLAAFQPFLGRSLSYLARQVDATGLLRASADDSPARHWLAPDNELALWAFDAARAGAAATALRAALGALPPAQHGLIEAMQGEDIAWPPQTPVQDEIQPGVWVESYHGGTVVAAWESDCFLALFAALDAWNAGNASEAQRLYAGALAQFDAAGCIRPQSPGKYAAADLAMAIFTGARIDAPVDKARIAALLALQAPSGGFPAAYTAAGPTGPTTTAATAYAALALMAVRQE